MSVVYERVKMSSLPIPPQWTWHFIHIFIFKSLQQFHCPLCFYSVVPLPPPMFVVSVHNGLSGTNYNMMGTVLETQHTQITHCQVTMSNFKSAKCPWHQLTVSVYLGAAVSIETLENTVQFTKKMNVGST